MLEAITKSSVVPESELVKCYLNKTNINLNCFPDSNSTKSQIIYYIGKDDCLDIVYSTSINAQIDIHLGTDNGSDIELVRSILPSNTPDPTQPETAKFCMRDTALINFETTLVYVDVNLTKSSNLSDFAMLIRKSKNTEGSAQQTFLHDMSSGDEFKSEWYTSANSDKDRNTLFQVKDNSIKFAGKFIYVQFTMITICIYSWNKFGITGERYFDQQILGQ